MTALLVGLAGCAGQTVTPIDIHDPVISVESRRFVADAQDAVSIARSGADYARLKLDAALEQRRTLLAGDAWKGVSEAVVASFRNLLDARVQLAELRLELAEARVDLAAEKLREVYAETALRHDIETYEMKPIRAQVDERLEAVRQVNRRIGDQLLVVDKASRAWWKSYRGLLSRKKHPDMFFTGF
jgi:hypothetical protein